MISMCCYLLIVDMKRGFTDENGELQVFLAEPKRALRRDILHIFPSSLDKDTEFVCLVFLQKSTVVLEDWGEEADAEKDRLLERVFLSFFSFLFKVYLLLVHGSLQNNRRTIR